MRKISTSVAFRRDVKKLSEKDVGKLKELICLLEEGSCLPEKYKDHALSGEWKGYRDAHMEPDWLLIYRATKESVYLARTGSHAELFGK